MEIFYSLGKIFSLQSGNIFSGAFVYELKYPVMNSTFWWVFRWKLFHSLWLATSNCPITACAEIWLIFNINNNKISNNSLTFDRHEDTRLLWRINFSLVSIKWSEMKTWLNNIFLQHLCRVSEKGAHVEMQLSGTLIKCSDC